MSTINGNGSKLKWLVAAIPLAAAIAGYGALKATTSDNRERIASLEQKLEERSLDLQNTGAGRLVLEKLITIDRRLERIELELKQISGRR
ncbi:MAG: hypothetical protein L0Z53_06790 [Acidobacteriales bacterium]|nr:hypothetical protein [Terriglobales bacterium]